MNQISFKTYFKVGSFLLKEAEGSEGIIKHLTHLEEIILTRKAEGLNIALNFINELNKIFKGHTDSKVFTTVKWDGAPAVICGINPENNKFFVSTKSVANANPKVNYTQEDIQTNHGNAPGLVQKLSAALSILPNVIKQGVYQGDFMFDKKDLSVVEHEGISYVAFKPNTITYAVPVDSDLGKKIQNSDIGVIFHTKYSGPSLTKLVKSSDVNSSEFNEVQNAWVEDAKFKDISGMASFTEEEEKTINEYIQRVQNFNKSIKWNDIPETVYAGLNTFINTLIREGKFVVNPDESFGQFIGWIRSKKETRGKIKSWRTWKRAKKNRKRKWNKETKISRDRQSSWKEKTNRIRKRKAFGKIKIDWNGKITIAKRKRKITIREDDVNLSRKREAWKRKREIRKRKRNVETPGTRVEFKKRKLETKRIWRENQIVIIRAWKIKGRAKIKSIEKR